jgi:hypothetical protein
MTFKYNDQTVEIKKVANSLAGHYFDTFINGKIVNQYSMFAKDAKIKARQIIDTKNDSRR